MLKIALFYSENNILNETNAFTMAKKKMHHPPTQIHDTPRTGNRKVKDAHDMKKFFIILALATLLLVTLLYFMFMSNFN